MSVPSGSRDDRAAFHQQERGDIHTGCVRACVCVCVRLYCRPDDRSSSGECYKGEETIFLTPLTLGSRKGYQTIGGLQQISDLAPSHPLYCSVSTGHPIGVTVEDIINGRTLHHDSSRRNIETQYSPSQMADFAGKAE